MYFRSASVSVHNYERNIEMVLKKIYKESDSSQMLFATVFELAYLI